MKTNLPYDARVFGQRAANLHALKAIVLKARPAVKYDFNKCHPRHACICSFLWLNGFSVQYLAALMLCLA